MAKPRDIRGAETEFTVGEAVATSRVVRANKPRARATFLQEKAAADEEIAQPRRGRKVTREAVKITTGKDAGKFMILDKGNVVRDEKGRELLFRSLAAAETEIGNIRAQVKAGKRSRAVARRSSERRFDNARKAEEVFNNG